MPYPKGRPRPPGSGRKAGSRNRSTLAVAQQLEELGFDPVKAHVTVIQRALKKGDLAVAERGTATLLAFVHPRLAAIDMKVLEESRSPWGHFTFEEMNVLRDALEQHVAEQSMATVSARPVMPEAVTPHPPVRDALPVPVARSSASPEPLNPVPKLMCRDATAPPGGEVRSPPKRPQPSLTRPGAVPAAAAGLQLANGGSCWIGPPPIRHTPRTADPWWQE